MFLLWNRNRDQALGNVKLLYRYLLNSNILVWAQILVFQCEKRGVGIQSETWHLMDVSVLCVFVFISFAKESSKRQHYL